MAMKLGVVNNALQQKTAALLCLSLFRIWLTEKFESEAAVASADSENKLKTMCQ
jgi:hypothetical protein